jgi:hypothetical protein
MSGAEKIANAWFDGISKHTENMRTDGKNLYSYNLLIGQTLPDGAKVVINYTGKNSVSQTTSKHVNAALRVDKSVIALQPNPK